MNIEGISSLIHDYLIKLSFEQRVEAINILKATLSVHSPFMQHPVDCVQWVKMNHIKMNDYNPNTMSPAEVKLLRTSLIQNGYTQPIVVYDDARGNYIVVDGAHRFAAGYKTPELVETLKGYTPVVKVNKENNSRQERMAATVRHNRARGQHRIEGMMDIVIELNRRGWNDEKISKELGMEPDEVLRMRQLSGLTELFADADFSQAWTVK